MKQFEVEQRRVNFLARKSREFPEIFEDRR